MRPPSPATPPASAATSPASAAASPVRALTALQPSAPQPAPSAAALRPATPPSRSAEDSAAISLEGIAAFAALSAEDRQRLAGLARIETLAADEEVAGFGAALVLDGAASVCATIVDIPVAPAARGALLTLRGSAVEQVALRIVAGAEGARVAVWDAPAIEAALAASASVSAELSANADRLQALAAATMGPLGDLDDEVRGGILDRLRARVVRPRETIVAAGAALPAVMLVVTGAVEIGDGDDDARLAQPGELLFSREAQRGAPAPAPASAAPTGAVLLLGDADVATELAAIPALSRWFSD
ncbi:SCP-like extracellular [Minicystis rosea]|nr:SCP-like extracellular [Minicystis rosea]